MKRILETVVIAFVLLVAVAFVAHVVSPPKVEAQYIIPGVHTLQVTIGAGVTQISTSSIPVKQVFFQNNQTHSMRVGDSLTTTSRGALLANGSPGGSITSGAFGMQQATDLNQWYVAGTQNDVIDVIYIQ